MTGHTTGPTERVTNLKSALAQAVASYLEAQVIIAEVSTFTPAERRAVAYDIFTAYATFHNLVYTGAVGFLAQDRDVQRHLRVRNAWELLTDIAGIERKKIKGILDTVSLVDGTMTATLEYLPDKTTTNDTNNGGGNGGNGDAKGQAAGGVDADGMELGIFDPQPTAEPIDVVFGDLYNNAHNTSSTNTGSSKASGTSSGAATSNGGGAATTSSGAGATGTNGTGTSAGAAGSGGVRKTRVETPEEEAVRRAKRMAKMPVDDIKEAALDPYRAEALKRVKDFLDAYKEQLDAGGKSFADGVRGALRTLVSQHTDINAFERAAKDYLVHTFPTPRPSAEFLAKNRGMWFKPTDQRNGYLVRGFLTHDDYRTIQQVIKANEPYMAAARSEHLLRVAQEHAESGIHAGGTPCEICKVVEEAGAHGKKLAFRVSSRKERNLDALIYSLVAGGGVEQGTIAVETFMVPELAYLDAKGKLRTGSAVSFINFDETLGFQAKRKIAVGCDARTGEPLVAGWIKPELNANRAINTLTKAMVFAQHQMCCGEGCEVPFEDCELHHIIPYAKGGPTVPRNLIPLCKACHMRMRDLNESQGGAYYKKSVDGTITAIDRHGERVIPQISENWIRDHIADGLPVPILVTTQPLPLKKDVKQDWDYTTPDEDTADSTGGGGRVRDTETPDQQQLYT